jgi:uncharacterized protein (TIGR04141 family)
VPRKKSPAARTSLYRLVGVPNLRICLQQKYLAGDTFTFTETSVGGRDALLVTGAMTTETASWAATLQGLTSYPIALGNTTAAAVLLIHHGETDAWALSYGMGFQLLDHTKVDSGFGQRVALRTADPKHLNSLTRTTLDQRSRTDRFSIPSGDHLRGFGVGDFGEIVTRLVAKAEIPSLTAGEHPLRIRGADALSVPLGRTPETLVRDLDQLACILDRAPAPDLEVLEQLVAVKNRPELIETLEANLSIALADPGNAKLSLSWPHERIDENGTPTSFRVRGAGRSLSQPQDGTPTLSTIVQAIANVEPALRLERLERIRVQLFRDADGDDPISADIPGSKWLAFETDNDGKRYCFHDGSWYLMDQGYAQKLRDRTRAIFDRDPGLTLPVWPAGLDERAYNMLAATALGGTLLDRKLIYTDLHHRGIELCDVLAADGVLIHVKSLGSSEPASHLLSQALVSTDALLHDQEARGKFQDAVIKAGGDPATIPNPVKNVVLGVARQGRPITSADLFTFTQVTLVRAVAQLEGRGVNVFVVPIQRPS